MKIRSLALALSIVIFSCAAKSEMQLRQELVDLKHELTRKPNDINLLFMVGNTHFMLGEYEDAIGWYETVLKKFPDCFAPLKYSGHACRFLGQPERAISYYHRALALKPEEAHAQYGLAESLLTLGNLKDGWRYWESRYKRGKDVRNFTTKQWRPGITLAHKTVLLRAEYGLGDTIQFVRYAQLLKHHGATVIVEAQKPLVTLLQWCPFIDRVVPLTRFEDLPAFDIQIPIMSLPYVFFDQQPQILDNTPYIFPDPALVSFWATQLEQDKKIKIGICWDCAPSFDKLRPALSKKVIKLREFLPLLELDSVSVYSLQKMNGTKQIAQLPPGITLHTFDDDFDKTNGRFMDTAAVIANLDLIVTVDTSVAHLAGAMGKPVWVLLPYAADWRWMRNRTDTPWYTSMQLFRQHEPGDWQSVIDDVVLQLGLS